MRKSINGLSGLVQNEMKLNPFAAGYFLFCGKRNRILKLLYRDKTGFALWYKRLEEERFPCPEKAEEALELFPLIADCDRRSHRTRKYEFQD